MILNTSDVLGSTVINLKQGKKAGEIVDVILDPYKSSVVGFQLTKGNWFVDPKILLLSDVKSINGKYVVIDSRSVIKSVSEFGKQLDHLLKINDYLTKSIVLTTSGKEIGLVSNISFDTEGGLINKLSVTNPKAGMPALKVDLNLGDVVTFSDEATIVKENVTAGSLPSNLGIIKPEDLTDKKEVELKSTQEPSYKAYPSESVQSADLEKNQAVYYQDISHLSRSKKDDKRKDVVGLFLTKNILTESDKVIAKRGDVVTNKILDEAEKEDLMDQVYKYTSLDPV